MSLWYFSFLVLVVLNLAFSLFYAIIGEWEDAQRCVLVASSLLFGVAVGRDQGSRS